MIIAQTLSKLECRHRIEWKTSRLLAVMMHAACVRKPITCQKNVFSRSVSSLKPQRRMIFPMVTVIAIDLESHNRFVHCFSPRREPSLSSSVMSRRKVFFFLLLRGESSQKTEQLNSSPARVRELHNLESSVEACLLAARGVGMSGID
jgi:hypothetical protein